MQRGNVCIFDFMEQQRRMGKYLEEFLDCENFLKT